MANPLQPKIIDALSRTGWEVINIQGASKRGWPDLIAFKDGMTVFIEVKYDRDTLSPMQEYRHKRLRDSGFTVIVARSIMDILHLI